MSCFKTCCSCTVVLLAILVALVFPYARWQRGEKFAISTAHSAIEYPEHSHSRYRRVEYTNPDLHYFQWWNFIVFDAQTHDHFTLVYGLIDHPRNSSMDDVAVITMKHLHRSTLKNNVSWVSPLSHLKTEAEFNLYYHDSPKHDTPVIHSLTTIGPNAYQIIAKWEQPNIEWNLVFHRVHGFYGSNDTEQGNKEHCSIVSTLFGYNSEVEGTITIQGQVYDISRTSRYRAYAAGSWGCDLPTGDDAINYPWTWAWLVIPGETPAQDLSVVAGTARFQTKSAIGDLEGGYLLFGQNKSIVSNRYADILHNTSYQIGLMASSSDEGLYELKVTQDSWHDFADEFGVAKLPLRQTFTSRSLLHTIIVDYHPTIDQYFRIPITIEKDSYLKVFSDFRAVGVKTHVFISERDEWNGNEKIIFDGWVDTMNAVEYAYVAPVNQRLMDDLFIQPELLHPANRM